VTVLTTTGGEPSAFAAKAATSTIPIVFTTGGDPVKLGLVASYSRPGGNATGVRLLTNPAEPKRLGLLRELVPQATTIGFLLSPAYLGSASQLSDVQEAVRTLNLQVHILQASTDREIESAFGAVTRAVLLLLPICWSCALARSIIDCPMRSASLMSCRRAASHASFELNGT
jgi:putative ABC transport system substrate-binding protein